MGPLLKSRLAAIVGVGLIVFGGVRAGLVVGARLGEFDFAHYYASARLLLEGEDPYRSLPYERWGLDPGPEEAAGRLIGATNPPPLVYLTVPFALLEPRRAQWAWNALQALALAWLLFITWLLVRDRLSGPEFLLVAGVTCSSAMLYYHFFYSQTQLLLAALVVTAGWLSLRERHTSALLIGSAAGALKLFPFAMLPWFVWRARARPRALLAAGVFVTGTILATPGLWRRFYEHGLPLVRQNALNPRFNFSIPSAVLNGGWLVTGHFDPGPGWWAFAYAASLAILVAASTARLPPIHKLALLMLASIAASPTAWPHYLVFTIPAFALASADLLRRPSPRRLLAIAACWCLVLEAMNGADSHFVLPIRVALSFLPLVGIGILALWLRWSTDSAANPALATPPIGVGARAVEDRG